MQRRRTNLDSLEESDRPRFLSELVDRFAQALSQQFPPASGYQHMGGWGPAPCVNPKRNSGAVQEACMMASWTISRGRFWGLHVRVVPQDSRLRTLRVTIEGYFPVIQSRVERIERWSNLPGRSLWAYFLMPILVILVMALLPLMAVYRLSKLWLREDVLAAALQLDSLWPEVQACWQGVIPLTRPLSPSLTYSIAVAAGTAATAGCFWLAGLASTGEAWRIVLYATGSILGLVSFAVLIFLIMTMLGLEV